MPRIIGDVGGARGRVSIRLWPNERATLPDGVSIYGVSIDDATAADGTYAYVLHVTDTLIPADQTYRVIETSPTDGTLTTRYITVPTGTADGTTVASLAVSDPGDVDHNVPAGGTTGQVLNKASDADYATAWTTLTDVDHGVPAGGTTGQVLAKASNTDFDAGWVDDTDPAFATPSIALGTAAAAGAAGTGVRSDSTIVAFDATPPVTQAFSDVAATGAAAVAARRDHTHGMPASPGGLTVTATKTADYAANSGELVPGDASAGDFSVTLPAPTNGATVVVTNVAATGVVTVLPHVAETIDGKATYPLRWGYREQAQEFVADGTNWRAVIAQPQQEHIAFPFAFNAPALSVPVQFAITAVDQGVPGHVLADAAATVPLTVVAGVNDTFLFNGEGFTVAPATYGTLAAVITAMGAAVGDASAEAFSTLVTPSDGGAGKILLTDLAHENGATLSFGGTDVAAALGFTANPDTFSNNTGQTFTIAGDHTALFPDASTVMVTGSTGNDNSYTLNGAGALVGGNTVITTVEAIPNATADGTLGDVTTMGAVVAGWTPSVGDRIVNWWYETSTAWDGVTPKADLFLGSQALGVGVVAGGGGTALVMNMTLAESTAQGGIGLNRNAVFLLSASGTLLRVVDPSPLRVVLTQDGTRSGGDPGSTHGAATLHLLVLPA